MKKVELVIIPSTGIGHLVPAVEFAKFLVHQDARFSATIIIIPSPLASTSPAYVESNANSCHSVRLIELPMVSLPSSATNEARLKSASFALESHKSHVNKILSDIKSNNLVTLAGLIVDMFTTNMINVASELGVPSYLYYTSNAAMLSFTLQLPKLDIEISTDFKDHKGDLAIPGYINTVSPLCVPETLFTRGYGYDWWMFHARNISKVKGIIVNTVYEVEPYAVESHANGSTPTVYSVGPLLDTQSGSSDPKFGHIMKWLDERPPTSVLFLCFGSKGSFSEAQVKEIATGLEMSGHSFLWALRKPPAEYFGTPTEYTNLEDILPEGFLKRTAERGMICGWAPQTSVLSHKAIGGFVSHCGWNSILESLWYGVPILTWPLYAEQKLNASQMVKDLELAFELRINFMNGVDFVHAEEIDEGIRCVMDKESTVGKKVIEMKEICRKAKSPGGSSFASLERFIYDVMERV